MTIKELKKQIKDFQKENKKKNEEFFKKAVAFVFEQHPDLKSFEWRQYTPYFMDGDPCEFSVNSDYIRINDDDEECSDELKYQIEKATKKNKAEVEAKLATLKAQKAQAIANENYTKAEQLKNEIDHVQNELDTKMDVDQLKNKMDMINTCTEVLQCFDDDILKNLFGDHVSVKVTAKTIKVSGCEHD